MYTPLPLLIAWMLMAHGFSTQALSQVPDLYNHRNIPLASQIQQVQIIPLLSFLISTNGITIYLFIQTGKRTSSLSFKPLIQPGAKFHQFNHLSHLPSLLPSAPHSAPNCTTLV